MVGVAVLAGLFVAVVLFMLWALSATPTSRTVAPSDVATRAATARPVYVEGTRECECEDCMEPGLRGPSLTSLD